MALGARISCPCLHESSLSPIPDEEKAVLGHTNNGYGDFPPFFSIQSLFSFETISFWESRSKENEAKWVKQTWKLPLAGAHPHCDTSLWHWLLLLSWCVFESLVAKQNRGKIAKLLRKNIIVWLLLLSSFEHICHQTLLREQVIILRWKCLHQQESFIWTVVLCCEDISAVAMHSHQSNPD